MERYPFQLYYFCYKIGNIVCLSMTIIVSEVEYKTKHDQWIIRYIMHYLHGFRYKMAYCTMALYKVRQFHWQNMDNHFYPKMRHIIILKWEM